MNEKKRLQVFVSSTYNDLKAERQAAVEAILGAGHIPAGMELFAAGDKSQLDVIRRWIKRSDIFMIIVGGRYGSIEPESQKSYIQLEYEHALELNKPLFGVVIEESALDRKVKEMGLDAIEKDNPDKYRSFVANVKSRMVAFWSDRKDIQLAIHRSIKEIEESEDLVGWIRGDEIEKARKAAAAAASSRVAMLENQIAVQEERIKQISLRPPELASHDPLLVQIGATSLGDGEVATFPGLRESFQLALKNIAKFGDTDVFPFPIENLVFFDCPDDALSLLEEIHEQHSKDFERLLGTFLHEEGLVAAGYSGFRWGSQLDPLWNAYLLGLVVSVGEYIERARVPVDRNVVFSYRFKPDISTGSLFDVSIGWPLFQKLSFEVAKDYSHVLVCDIADYYLYINHRHLDNALRRAVPKSGIVGRITSLLKTWSKGVGYGLPVGGPAARLLSEILLNDVDRLLLSSRVVFHRFVDDYCIFAKSEQEARSHLALLSELLHVNDSLSVQKAKTRILSADEFRALNDPSFSEDEAETLDRQVLRLRLHFDPYSPTKTEDYEALVVEMSKYPIDEMLARQMRKSRVDQAVTKKLIQMVRFQEPSLRARTVASLIENLELLYPVFPTVMILLRNLISELDEEVRQLVFWHLRGLIAAGSHIVRVPANLLFAVRVLAHDRSEDTTQTLISLYKVTESMMLKRDIILALARNGVDYWVSARLRDFDRVAPWERRALLVASYILGMEGADFRKSVAVQLQPMERLMAKWASERAERGALEIPV